MKQMLEMLKRQLQYAKSNIEVDKMGLEANINIREELEQNLKKSEEYLQELQQAISILEKSSNEQVKAKKQK